MRVTAAALCVMGIACAANAGALTLDDLSIGTILAGDSVLGDTNGSSNDMNGVLIATSIFSWSGNDDVYTLNWGGGDLVLDLFYTAADGDLDMFVFDSNLAGSAIGTSLTTSDDEQIELLGLAAGTYYVSVDGWSDAANSYTLNVSVPAPASMALLGLGGLVAGRRRR
ncbi:hypothetical protein COB72_08510 [bacterium]|nr:MAG: hypothetical protein COB72_08510 [bacterium]